MKHKQYKGVFMELKKYAVYKNFDEIELHKIISSNIYWFGTRWVRHWHSITNTKGIQADSNYDRYIKNVLFTSDNKEECEQFIKEELL